MSMFCYQCGMSSPDGCGSEGQTEGICGKDENLARLQDLMVFGVKGLAAYRIHAADFGADTKEIDDVMAETMYFTLSNVDFSFDRHIAQLMKLGTAGVQAMGLLSEAYTQHLGVPTPVQVTQNRAEGKAILVSGHDLLMLKNLLEATAGRGVNVYTHSEMLPAHAYPELRQHDHLKGNIGKSWFDQKTLFEQWSGALVVNTDCIVPPAEDCGYVDRLFTYAMVGVEGARRIEDGDYSELIDTALALPDITNFTSDEILTTGHHYKTVLTLAPQILDAVKAGNLKRFFVIAGCDAPGRAGEYFRELTQKIPQDAIIITSSCGKFRFNDIDFGTVPNTELPRYLDLGQCNDSNGAVEIALVLSQALGTPMNDLPVNIILSWMGQKAVIILLALFSLGIKDIRLGPKPPQFVNEDIVNFLIEQFNFGVTTTVDADLAEMLS